MRKMGLWLATAVVAAATGCAWAPTVSEVQDAAANATTAIYDNTGAGGDTAMNMPTLTALSGSLSTMQKVAPVVEQLVMPSPELVKQLMVRPELAQQFMLAPKATATGEQKFSDDMHAAGQKLAKFFRERIFTEANLESQDGSALIFRITGEDVCVTEDPATGNYVPSADTTCVPNFDKYEIRIKAQKTSSSLQLTPLFGPDRFSPLFFELAPRSVAITTDFDQLKKTYLYAAQVTGVTVTLPEVMQGQVKFTVTGHADDDYEVAVEIPSAIRIEQASGTAKFFVRADSHWGPVASVRYIGSQKELIATLDMGVMEVGVPYAIYSSMAATHGAGNQVTWHFGGASYSFDTKEGDTDLMLTNVGLGGEQTYWELDGTRITTVDVNESAGRHFDLHVVAQAGTEPLFKFSPQFAMKAGYHMQPLAADFPATPSWEMSETLSVVLDGTDPTLQTIPADTIAGTPGALKVVSGALTLTSSQGSISVPSGQCLLKDTTSTSTHPFGGFIAGACP